MKSAQYQVSSCSRCRFYAPEGRRGGQCSQLGVPVESRWVPCSLAAPVFESSLAEIKPLTFLPQVAELSVSAVQLEAALLKAPLEAPTVASYPANSVHPAPAPLPISH